eukprot:tig00001077_g6834.t1
MGINIFVKFSDLGITEATNLDFVAGLNGGSSIPCAAPALAIALLDVNSVSGPTKGKVWWGRSVALEKADLKIKGSKVTYGAEVEALFSGPSDEPAIAQDGPTAGAVEVSGKFAAPNSAAAASITWNAGTGADGLPTGCSGTAKTTSQIKVTMPLAVAVCNDKKKVLGDAFKAQAAVIDTVAVSCAAAGRRRLAGASNATTEQSLVAYDYTVSSGSAYALGQTLAAIIKNPEGANALIAAINEANGGQLIAPLTATSAAGLSTVSPVAPKGSVGAGLALSPSVATAFVLAAASAALAFIF